MGRKAFPVNKKAGKNIKQLLSLYNWTQDQLAQELHITPQTLSNQLNGRCGIPPESYQIIAGLFPGTRLAWIMGIDDYRTDEECAAAMAKDESDRAVAPFEALFILLKAFDYDIVPISHDEDGNNESQGKEADYYITYRQREICSITHRQLIHLVDDIAYYAQCRLLKETMLFYPDWTNLQSIMYKQQIARQKAMHKEIKELFDGKHNTKDQR